MTARVFACLFALLTILAMLSACGSGAADGAPAAADVPAQTAETAAETAEETEPDPYENLHGLDFGGYEYTVISYGHDNWCIYIAPEEMDGELLNDAAFQRNAEVEELLNVKVSSVLVPGTDDSEKQFRNAVLAGDGESYDMICFWSPGARAVFVTDGIAADWAVMPYIELESEWYNQSANAAYRIAGKQFFGVSDFTYTVQQCFHMFCNLGLMDDLGLEHPYQTVFDGDWTVPKMLEYCAGVYADLNGDGREDLEDRYGLVVNAAFSSAFVDNAGEMPVRSGENGFELNLCSDRIIRIVEEYVSWKQDPDVFTNPNGNNDQYNIFKGGRALFMPYGSDPALIRDYEVEVGYVPYPKFDEQQDDYVCWSAGGMMALPTTMTDPERTGAVVQALSAASGRYLRDAFVEKYIEGKVLRDAESVEIYRMLRQRATFDISYNIDPSGLIGSHAWFAYFYNKSTADVASRLASVEEKIVSAYAEVFAAAAK